MTRTPESTKRRKRPIPPPAPAATKEAKQRALETAAQGLANLLERGDAVERLVARRKDPVATRALEIWAERKNRVI